MFQVSYLKLISVISIAALPAFYFLTQSEDKPLLTNEEEQLLLNTILPVSYRAQIDKPLSEAATLGQKLFEDERLSVNQNIACRSCHLPTDNFHDIKNRAGQVFNEKIKAPSLRGVHAQSWFFWNGRTDSLWSQALEATRNEHGLSSEELTQRVCGLYFDESPQLLEFCHSEISDDEKYKKIGGIFGSYVETIDHYWSRFDEFLYRYAEDQAQGSDFISYDELAGLKLFFNREKTGCIDCHSGQRFTNDSFYAIGTGIDRQNDRIEGIQAYLASNYRCEQWEKEQDCIEYKFMRKTGDDLVGAYKVPSLRNLYKANSFMHDRRFKNLDEVLHFYMYPTGYMHEYVDVKPLRLTKNQRKQLITFIQFLNEPYQLQETK